MKQGMTMAEKALAKASGRDVVRPGEFVTAGIDALVFNEISFSEATEDMDQIGRDEVWDPDKIVVVIDHVVPATEIRYAEQQKKVREYVQKYGIKNFYDTGNGICHLLLQEKGHALPGRLIVGADSHAGTMGAMGAVITGIGVTEALYVMVKGSLWFQVPETIRFVLNGSLPKGVSSKDILLHIADRYTTEVAQYKAIEFSGPIAEELSISQRATMSNMGVELGAKFALFEADDKTMAYLKGRTDQPIEPFGPDPDARYLAVHEIDVSPLEPQISCPHDVGNVKPVSAIGDVPVHQAFIGSCTNAQVEDLERAAAILKGRRIHPRTRLLVIPASREVYTNIARSGVLQTFLEAGAMMGATGCGPCMGLHMGVLAAGENGISSTNRNFKGRMGSLDSLLYLASPETVAASAIEGRIADPRKYIR